MRIEEEENQNSTRRKKAWETAAAFLQAPIEKTAMQSFKDLSHLVRQAFTASEGETVNRTMSEYIELNRQADTDAFKLHDKIRFEEKHATLRTENQRGLAKREITSN